MANSDSGILENQDDLNHMSHNIPLHQLRLKTSADLRPSTQRGNIRFEINMRNIYVDGGGINTRTHGRAGSYRILASFSEAYPKEITSNLSSSNCVFF